MGLACKARYGADRFIEAKGYNVHYVEAGEGDEVLVCLEAQSAVDAIGRGENPVDAVVVAIIDQVKLADGGKEGPWTRA